MNMISKISSVVLIAGFVISSNTASVEAKNKLQVGQCQNVISMIATTSENGNNPHPACVPNKIIKTDTAPVIKKHHRNKNKSTITIVTVNTTTTNSGNTDNSNTGSDGGNTKKKVCKNKNQYKEGTSDCNAGKGNN